nr:MAG TPA: hypothetical protein [Caudoviricetes sp.]
MIGIKIVQVLIPCLIIYRGFRLLNSWLLLLYTF